MLRSSSGISGIAQTASTVDLRPGVVGHADASLAPEALLGQEVVVTAQLRGQRAAINQQLTSNRIVNVVSKDRIQELPDNNAAESISRLPGISIERDAGEGSKVVIRGLAPTYNAITVNGQKIPATDPQNRSVDLSMISSDILCGDRSCQGTHARSGCRCGRRDGELRPEEGG